MKRPEGHVWLAPLLSLIVMGIPAVENGFACLSNPCVHGVCLDDLNSTYFCYCIDGYTGIQCQTNWNECWSAPCQNGGLCIDGIAMFNCSCPPGFVGELCEEDVNECESNPCLNNGTCLDAANSYSCNCLVGYSGVHCEIDIAVCNSTNETRCANGGVCEEGPGDSFVCRCQPGWHGFMCEDEIDECLSAPCQNGAVCIDLHADYACACLFGFSGKNCEEMIHLCPKNSCKNGALCLIEEGHDTCYCVPDFHGELCQFQYDECQLGPRCMNGGTCIDGIDNFTCSCPPNLTGVLCECLLFGDNQLDCNYIAPNTVLTSSTTEIPTTLPATIITSETSTVPNLSSKEPSTMSTTLSSSSTESYFNFTTEPQTIFTSSEVPGSTTSILVTESSETSTYGNLSTVTSSWGSTGSTTVSETVYETESTSILTTIDVSVSTLTREIGTSTLETTFTTLPIQSTTETTFLTTESSSTEIPSIETPRIDQTIVSTTFSSEPTDFSSTSTMLTSLETTEVPTSMEPPSVIDCSQSETQCQNGGTCVLTHLGHECLCPFDTEGLLCEIRLGIKKAAFTGDSYLSHRLLNFSRTSFEFEAQTLSDTGLLFYSNIDSTYMSLYLEEGYLKFKFSCGYQTMLLSELKVPVNNGYPMSVKARLEYSDDWRHCDAIVKVNDTLSMMGDQMAVVKKYSKPVAWLYLGGIPSGLSNENFSHVGFVGCMSNLRINEEKVDIFKEAEDGLQIKECSSLVCLSNPCRNGASCFANGEQWECKCKNGFLGPMCEQSVCDNNPCLFGGTCIPFTSSGYLCLCPYGKHGHFCENDLKISEPFFSSSVRGYSSFVAYPMPEGVFHSMEIKFRFTPTSMEQISILLFIGQNGNHDFFSDHLAVSFVKGYIMLTWNLGSGPRRIFTAQPIKKGARDYLVRIGHFGRRAWLFVENLGNVTGRAPGNLVQLDVVPLLYLGGYHSRNFSTLPHDLPLHTGFSGCIFDVEIKSGSVVIPIQGNRQTIGRAVGQCGTTECYEKSCQNDGACLHHGSTFMCLCQDGWYGPLCSSINNLCDFSWTQCAKESTCVPQLNSYQCDCPLGRTGKFCRREENITDISLTGQRSYISLHPTEFDDFKFNIEMEIRTLNDQGVVLFIGRKGYSFVCLSLQNGLLELRIKTGRNKLNARSSLVIRSNKLLIKAVWHKVYFGLFGRKVYLSVDGIINTGILAPGENVDVSKQKMLLGGAPDLSDIPNSATSSFPTPFTGCIRHFSIDSRHILLTSENIESARNVNDCDGTPCGGDFCENGGTCWLDSFMSPHCSCPKPYYGDRCENIPTCTEKKCMNEGACIDSKCSCKVGWNGAFCEAGITVKVPQFMGKSYLIVKSSTDKRRNVRRMNLERLNLNFTSANANGLLLWSEQDTNYIGIGIERGFLKVSFSFNGAKNYVEVPSLVQIADGLWHSLEITFAPFSVNLDKRILKMPLNHDKLSRNSVMMTNGVFFIGGIPKHHDSLLKETNGMFTNSFEGCIEGFGTNLEVVEDFSRLEGQNIGVCNVI